MLLKSNIRLVLKRHVYLNNVYSLHGNTKSCTDAISVSDFTTYITLANTVPRGKETL